MFEVKSGGGEGEYVFAGIDGNTHVILIYRETCGEYEKEKQNISRTKSTLKIHAVKLRGKNKAQNTKWPKKTIGKKSRMLRIHCNE